MRGRSGSSLFFQTGKDKVKLPEQFATLEENMSSRESVAAATLPIVFENINCMMCGSSESVPAGTTTWRGNTLAYSLCRGCGLKFMNPRPTRQWYLDFYASEFWEDKFQNKSRQEGTRFNWIWKLLKGGVSGRMRKGMKRAQLVVPEILKHVQVNSTSRVLDVGCAFGLILHEIEKEFDFPRARRGLRIRTHPS